MTLLAIVLGPILAVQAEKWIERLMEERREKLIIFRTLMRTRNNIVSHEHVDALNMIALVFSKKKRKDLEVLKKWDSYLNFRNSPAPTSTEPAVQLEFANRAANHLKNLLIAMATTLGHRFDQEHIERVYSPQAHNLEAAENQAARQLLLRLLRGDIAVKTQTSIFPGDLQATKDFNTIRREE